MKLNPRLQAFYEKLSAALPNVTVQPEPYDIGYWSERVGKINPEANCFAPIRVTSGESLVAFRRGVAQAKNDIASGDSG